jgi:hypothetical protein
MSNNKFHFTLKTYLGDWGEDRSWLENNKQRKRKVEQKKAKNLEREQYNSESLRGNLERIYRKEIKKW